MTNKDEQEEYDVDESDYEVVPRMDATEKIDESDLHLDEEGAVENQPTEEQLTNSDLRELRKQKDRCFWYAISFFLVIGVIGTILGLVLGLK